MTAPERSRFAEYRDKLRGGPPRALEPCGTIAAVRRHERAGEDLCDACLAARKAYNAAQYEARKAAGR